MPTIFENKIFVNELVEYDITGSVLEFQSVVPAGSIWSDGDTVNIDEQDTYINDIGQEWTVFTIDTYFDYYDDLVQIDPSYAFTTFWLNIPDNIPDQDDSLFSFRDVYKLESSIPAEYTPLDLKFSLYAYKADTGDGYDWNNTTKEYYVEIDEIRNFGADTIYNDAKVFLWGNCKRPTKEPAFVFMDADGGSPKRVAFQLEYKVGDISYYGKLITPDCDQTVNSFNYISIEWQGETALNVFTINSGSWKLYERLTFENVINGRYVTNRINDSNEGSMFTFDSRSFDPNIVSNQEDYQSSDYYEEPNSIYMSVLGAPFSVTTDSIKLPINNNIRLISSARLNEEEDIRSYEFYIFTDCEIFVGRRDGDSLFIDEVTKTFGISLYDDYPVFTKTDYGIIFCDTNNFLRYISSRQYQRIDTSVNFGRDNRGYGTENNLWSEIYDLAYHQKRDEIYILSDTGIWIYNKDQGGIIGNIEENVTTLNYFQKDITQFGFPDNGLLLGKNGNDTTIFDESGSFKNSSLTLQIFNDNPLQINIKVIEMDFDGTISFEHSLRYSNIVSNYTIGRRIPFYPRLKGTGHIFKMEGFEELRQILMGIFSEENQK